MSSEIIATGKLLTRKFEFTVEIIGKNYGTHLAKLGAALLELNKNLSFDAWKDAEIMKLARNLNQQIGNVENLANRGYDVGMNPSACTALFKKISPYAAASVPFAKTDSETVQKHHLEELVNLLKEAKALK